MGGSSEKEGYVVKRMLNLYVLKALEAWRGHVGEAANFRNSIADALRRMNHARLILSLEAWRDHVAERIISGDHVKLMLQKVDNSLVWRSFNRWWFGVEEERIKRESRKETLARIIFFLLMRSFNIWRTRLDNMLFCQECVVIIQEIRLRSAFGKWQTPNKSGRGDRTDEFLRVKNKNKVRRCFACLRDAGKAAHLLCVAKRFLNFKRATEAIQIFQENRKDLLDAYACMQIVHHFFEDKMRQKCTVGWEKLLMNKKTKDEVLLAMKHYRIIQAAKVYDALKRWSDVTQAKPIALFQP